MNNQTLKSALCPPSSLREVIEDYDALLTDPAAVLARNEIRISPNTPHRLAIIMLIFWPLIAAAVYYKVFGGWSWLLEAGAFVFGLVLAALLVVAPSRGTVILQDKGVVFLDRRERAVWCPWQLFCELGNILEQPTIGRVIVPVSSKAIPHVVLRRNGTDGPPTASGKAANNSMLWFAPGNNIELDLSYGSTPVEVGELLIHLGRNLGTKPMIGSVAMEIAPPDERPTAGERAIADGWVTVRMTRLAFPNSCSRCGVRTNDTYLTLFIVSRVGFLMQLLSLGHYHAGGIDLSLPYCVDCRNQYGQAWWRALWGGIGGAVILSGLFSIGIFVADWRDPEIWVASFLTTGLFLCPCLTTSWTRRRWSPLRRAWYVPRDQTVQIRFRRPEFAELVAQHLNPSAFRSK